MNIARTVEVGRRRFPDRPALIFEGRTVSYGELEQMAARLANGLRRVGAKRGVRVALFLPNIPEFVVSYLAIEKIGAIAVSLSSALKTEEVKLILEDCGATHIITTRALRENVPHRGSADGLRVVIAEGESAGELSLTELMANASPGWESLDMERDDPAAIVYTSGTTGLPKGATLSHGNVISNIEAKKKYLGIRPPDRLLLFMPLHHCFGQNAILNSGLNAGATIVLHRQFDPHRVMRSIVDDRISMFFGVPTTFLLLLDKASVADMRSVRYSFSAAASLPLEVEKRWRQKFGAIIYQGYGLTETSPFASYNHHLKHKPGSIGAPIENVEMKIISIDDGRAVKPGESGEIVIRGANVMLGYWNRPLETAEVLRNGWFHSGDIGRMDDEGYFYIEDRLKDMIDVGGLNVFPAEIENVIYKHPAVAEVAVYGLPDVVMGEQVRANVILKPGQSVTAEDLITFCRQRLANFKAPSRIEFVHRLPKSRTGKVLKRVLRETVTHPDSSRDHAADTHALSPIQVRQSPPTPSPTAESIQDWIVDWLMKNLAIDADAVEIGKPLAELGLDSVLAVKMARDLGDRLGRPLQATITWTFPEIESLARHLATAGGTTISTEQNDVRTETDAREQPRSSARAAADLGSLSDTEMIEVLAEEIATIRKMKSQ